MNISSSDVSILSEYSLAFWANENLQKGLIQDSGESAALAQAKGKLEAAGLSHEDWLVYEAKRLLAQAPSSSERHSVDIATKKALNDTIKKSLTEQLIQGLGIFFLGLLAAPAGIFLLKGIGFFKLAWALAFGGVAAIIGGLYVAIDAIIGRREWRNSQLPEGKRKVKKKTYRSEYR